MTDYKVLIPLDGSRVAERSLAYVPALMSLGHLEVQLTSVAEEPADAGGLSHKEAVDKEYNLLATYLREVADDLRKHVGIEVETSVLPGSAAATILQEAKRFGPDLIVISTHGRSGPARWRLGSVADKIVRTATCATLVVGPGGVEGAKWFEAGMAKPFQSILVPLDGSHLAEQSIAVARRYAEAFESQVHLVRVVSPPIIGDGLGLEGAYAPDYLTAVEEGAREYVNESKARFSPSTKLKTAVLVGFPASELEDYVKRNAVDLIVMTSHGRGGILRAALGSVTDRMIGSTAPVLIVRPGA